MYMSCNHGWSSDDVVLFDDFNSTLYLTNPIAPLDASSSYDSYESESEDDASFFTPPIKSNLPKVLPITTRSFPMVKKHEDQDDL